MYYEVTFSEDPAMNHPSLSNHFNLGFHSILDSAKQEGMYPGLCVDNGFRSALVQAVLKDDYTNLPANYAALLHSAIQAAKSHYLQPDHEVAIKAIVHKFLERMSDFGFLTTDPKVHMMNRIQFQQQHPKSGSAIVAQLEI